ncbi:MAG: methyltransferase domain-containing protein [Desulfobacterales bacterium]|nr:methyltransferase domain-containing protein [Desulfobacterales bacterium]
MKKITSNSTADIEFQLNWKLDNITHTEAHMGYKINFWRDCFPQKIYNDLIGMTEGETLSFNMKPTDIIPDYDPNQVKETKLSQFNGMQQSGITISPRPGRYYPRGFLKDMPGIYRNNVVPFRCLETSNKHIQVDFNHPLAGRDIQLSVTIYNIMEKPVDRGGSCSDWLESISTGPGMQSRINGKPTDFFSDHPFERSDENEDTLFYQKPRLINHIDDFAIGTVTQLYAGLLKPDSAVLDLMSSWQSHLPTGMTYSKVTGLGLNRAELQNNTQLSDYAFHDLNGSPFLPFDDGSYDAVTCNVSVEYLTQPFEVFNEVTRVLKPGGIFIVTFSNRWFPPKAVNIWQQIHEYERMGLVLEYFLNNGRFSQLGTHSSRGYDRPSHDKYYSDFLFSDPVFAVWGFKT